MYPHSWLKIKGVSEERNFGGSVNVRRGRKGLYADISGRQESVIAR